MSNWGTLNHHHPFCYYWILRTPIICRKIKWLSNFFIEIENGYQESRKSNYYVAKMRVGCKNPDFLCRIGNDTFAICTHLFLRAKLLDSIYSTLDEVGWWGEMKKRTQKIKLHLEICIFMIVKPVLQLLPAEMFSSTVVATLFQTTSSSGSIRGDAKVSSFSTKVSMKLRHFWLC